MEPIRKPYEFRMVLAQCLPCVLENGQILAWGCRLLQEVPTEQFEAMREHGEWFYVDMEWHLLLRKFHLEELIEKFGGVTEVGLGPKGGFKYIIFGKTKFENKILKETAVQLSRDCPGLIKECDRRGNEKPRVPRCVSGGRAGMRRNATRRRGR
jgi:hypothetical protein